VNCHQEKDWNVVLVVFRHQINVPRPAALMRQHIPIVISKKMVGVLRWLSTFVKKQQRENKVFTMTQNICYLCEMRIFWKYKRLRNLYISGITVQSF
jgi:hypothetical protein